MTPNFADTTSSSEPVSLIAGSGPINLLYLRTSSTCSAESSERAQCEEHLRAKGFDLSDFVEIIDNAHAGNYPRPGRERLMALVAAGRVGVLAAYSLDRLERHLSRATALISTVTDHGGRVLLLADDIDTADADWTLRSLLRDACLKLR